MTAKHVIVIGAGLAGLTCAWELCSRGLTVTVIDAARGPAQRASFATGGWIGPQSLRTSVQLRSRGQLLRTHFGQNDPQAGLRWNWKGHDEAADFLARSQQLAANPNFGSAWCRDALRSLGDRSLTLLNRLIAAQAITDCRSKGLLHVFSTEAALDAAVSGANPRLGLTQAKAFTSAQCRVLEPVIFDNAPIAGGLQLPLDFTVNAAFLCRELAYSEQSRGVQFVFDEAVEGFLTQDHTVVGVKTGKESRPADAVVLASGSSAPGLLQKLPVPLEFLTATLWAQSITAEVGDFPYRMKMSLLWEEEGILATALGERIRLTGTPFCAPFDAKVSEEEVKRLSMQAMTLLGSAANWRKMIAWHEEMIACADGLPLAGALPGYPGLYVSFAHGMSGAATAGACAEIVADAVTDTSANELAPLVSPLRAAAAY